MKDKKTSVSSGLGQLIIPLVALLLLIIFNLIKDPSFFSISVARNTAGNLVFTGSIITIFDYASELVILALGMTLVTAATGGQDISVGATIAITGSTLIKCLCGNNTRPETLLMPIACAFLISVVVAMLCGAFNGTLVAVFKIPPMVATLILYTAGRSIAAWINNNELPIIDDPKFAYFGGVIPNLIKSLPTIPTPVFIAIGCVVIMILVLKFTNLGLYTQTVGINEKSARLNGINPTLIKILSFVILGICVAVAALIKVSRIQTINYSVIAKDIEMDAILAVALGGNALSGGKFNIWASILGAYIIQFLTTTLYKCQVSSDSISAYKAVVVIILVVLSADPVRALGKKIKASITNSDKSKAKEA